jgi:hypothetical protein
MSKFSTDPMNIRGNYGYRVWPPECYYKKGIEFDGEKADVFAAAHVLMAIYTNS